MALRLAAPCAGTAIDSTITVQCALESSQPLSTLSSPTNLAAVQLTVYEVAGVGACTQPVTPSTRVYSASATVTPLPRLRIAAGGATICSSETQATVGFSFAASEHMAPLNENQFTIKAKTAAETDAAGMVCTAGTLQAWDRPVHAAAIHLLLWCPPCRSEQAATRQGHQLHEPPMYALQHHPHTLTLSVALL